MLDILQHHLKYLSPGDINIKTKLIPSEISYSDFHALRTVLMLHLQLKVPITCFLLHWLYYSW